MAEHVEAHLPPPPSADYLLAADILERAHDNPPPYDELISRLISRLFGGLVGHGWKPPVPYVDGVQDRCPCMFLTAGSSVRCSLPAGHGPDHKAEDGTAWFNPYEPEPTA